MTNKTVKISIQLGLGTTTDKVNKKVIEVVEGSQEWKEVLCISTPQSVARRYKYAGVNKHFEVTDLESYLTEEAYKVLLKYEPEKNPRFDIHLFRCLCLKALSFLNDREVDKSTDYYSQRDGANSDSDDVSIFEPTASNVWEVKEAELNLDRILHTYPEKVQLIVKKYIEGYTSSYSIESATGIHYKTVSRTLKKLKEDAVLCEALNDLIEAQGSQNLALFELVSTEESYYSEERSAKRKKSVFKGQSTTKPETFARVKAYKKMVKESHEANKELHRTFLEWRRELAQKEKEKESL